VGTLRLRGRALSVNPNRGAWVVRWRDNCAQRARRFRTEAEAIAFDEGVSGGAVRPRSSTPNGVEARSRALVSQGEEAERLYREAIERLGRTNVRVALARAHLLYGEWLRRQGRRVDASAQLRAAHQSYAAMGMEGFAERARRELVATGERVRKRSVEARDELTAQETQIARLAADGRTNPEIGAHSSAPARSNGTCGRCSQSSGSALAASSPKHCARRAR